MSVSRMQMVGSSIHREYNADDEGDYDDDDDEEKEDVGGDDDDEHNDNFVHDDD